MEGIVSNGTVSQAREGRSLRLALFGAAPDTANRGVSALFVSAITELAKRLAGVEFVVFDNGLGERHDQLSVPGITPVQYVRFGGRIGRRYYRAEHLEAMALAARCGSSGAWLNRGVKLIDSCDVILDVSGGDSFSDIYGNSRFRSVYLPKAIAKARRKPLILLPQTYGPYKAQATRVKAAEATRFADMAWARDEESYVCLRDLLGDAFDPHRHRSGVDMAFGLSQKVAEHALDDTLRSWLKTPDRLSPLVGFNVSGLVYHSVDGGRKDFGLRDSYRNTVVGFLRALFEQTNARVVLIPHVMAPQGGCESDPDACTKVVAELARFAGRIAVSSSALSASEAKWVVAQMDWFCGTRMHSTIAGLSSGVPTAAIAYSDKTRGVFSTCGQREAVFDPRVMNSEQMIRGLLDSFERRDDARESLRKALVNVRSALGSQFDDISARIESLAVSLPAKTGAR